MLIADSTHGQIAEIFANKHPTVVTRMCSDMNRCFLNTLPKNRKALLILAANEAPQFEFVGTTLHVDDYMKCNYYVTIHNANKITTIALPYLKLPGAYFLGFCFNISELADDCAGGSCFSNLSDYSIVVSSKCNDDDGCYGCF
jgi:hypothetical protein